WNINPLVHASWIATPAAAALGFLSLWWLRRVAGSVYGWCCAAVLGVLFSPRVGDYHYSLLLIPVVVCCVRLWVSCSKTDLLLFGGALLLLSTKIPYNSDIFQKTWLGVFGFPRVYGALLILFLLTRLHRTPPPVQSSVVQPSSTA